jgi:hypothetical protein
LKPQQRDSTPVLRRPVEPATFDGTPIVFVSPNLQLCEQPISRPPSLKPEIVQ